MFGQAQTCSNESDWLFPGKNIFDDSQGCKSMNDLPRAGLHCLPRPNIWVAKYK